MFLLTPRTTSNLSSFFYNPWFYFIIFTLTNALLAYGSLNFKTNLCIAAIGWALPMILGVIYFSKAHSENDLFREDTIPTVPIHWWLLTAILALIPRLYILFNSSWLNPDEGLFGFLSLEISKIWKWHFFFTFAQAPPLFNWSAAIFFKWFTPSIFSMRLFQFILSIITILLVYRCGRNFFSKSFIFSCLYLFAFSFWPLYISVFFEPLSLLPILEIMSFWTLGSVLNSNKQEKKNLNRWCLGLVTGLGFWVAIQWPLVASMIFLALFYKFKKQILTFYQLWIPTLLFFIPFCFFSVVEKNGEHIKTLLAFSLNGDVLKRLSDSFSNWTALFWGCDLQNSYGPVWGGMLNPISGALFFIGIFELIYQKKISLSRWVLTTFFAFMIPGVITNSFEIFRNEQIEPLLLLICALGFQSLIFHTSNKFKKSSLIIIFFFSAGLDMIHLWKVC
jgi:4-amino-4-deoxy-L-arabinose transferase-like glycosyltransferase